MFIGVKNWSEVYARTRQTLIHFANKSVSGTWHVRSEHWDISDKVTFELLHIFFCCFSVFNCVRNVLSMRSQVEQILVLTDKSLFPILLQSIIQTNNHCIALVQYFKHNKYCSATMNYAINVFFLVIKLHCC